jgi:hypothetical protein
LGVVGVRFIKTVVDWRATSSASYVFVCDARVG